MQATRLVVALILAFAVLVAPLAAPAQQPPEKTARIGFLGDVPAFLDEAFRQGLRELGYVEGQNIAIEHRAPDWKVGSLDEACRTSGGGGVGSSPGGAAAGEGLRIHAGA